MNVSTRVSHPHSIFWASEARDSILHIPVLLCNPRFASEARHVYIFSNVRVTVSPIANTARLGFQKCLLHVMKGNMRESPNGSLLCASVYLSHEILYGHSFLAVRFE